MQLKVIFLFVIISLVNVLDMNGQACRAELTEANQNYVRGMFDQSKSYIASCLNKSNITIDDRSFAYRLLALNHLGLGDPSEAQQAVTMLVKINPAYDHDAILDPPDFVSMLKEVKRAFSSTNQKRSVSSLGSNREAIKEGGNESGERPPYYKVGLTNGCNKKIYVSVMYLELNEENWMKEGWWEIAPKETSYPAIYTRYNTLFLYAFQGSLDKLSNQWEGKSKDDPEEYVVGEEFTIVRGDDVTAESRKKVRFLNWNLIANNHGTQTYMFTCR